MAARCAGFIRLCPVRYLIVVFSGSCLECDFLIWGEGAVCSAFRLFVAYELSFMVCLLFLLVSLVSYVL